MRPREFTVTTTHYNINVDNVPCTEAVDPSRRAAAAADAVVEVDPPAVAVVGRQLCSSLNMKNAYHFKGCPYSFLGIYIMHITMVVRGGGISAGEKVKREKGKRGKGKGENALQASP